MGAQCRVALVTEGGNGSGRAVALELLDHGYFVSLAGRHRESLDQTREMAPEPIRPHALPVPTDVSDERAVEGLFAEIERTWGRLDGMFNNAGRGAPAVPIDELTVERWSYVCASNLTGMF